ncbi:MAG: aminomethyl-transferring glycine dehydrogenase [Candidatus Goldiibacteriota bacterium HGW-Goldbacteria-1]|jgi:glycine dehydrogenase subunit 1|nr:MAG: aminomethyl-transferring glycine dehydrogenase [Candidatus Goldiibacteriota bacterium HGW-Goldbacteria-1]
MAGFTPHTESEIKEMLQAAGAPSIESLFFDITPELRAKSFNLPKGITEYEALNEMQELASKNTTFTASFLGGGYYDHFIPAAVDTISSRAEFYTAYTPYQPEASQGTLRAVFEYQSMISGITGMELSNASLYDGGTAIYEAVNMAFRGSRKKKVIIDGGVNPLHVKMLKTHAKNIGVEFIEAPAENGRTDLKALAAMIDSDTAAVVAQNPNFYGFVNDYSPVFAQAAKQGAASILSFYPVSLGILKTPAEMGADIAVAEGQSLGQPLSFGGPYLGIMAVNKKFMRKIPGRIVGETTDKEGRTVYVLTLQAREQHIKREKATSNICSNQALCALRAVVFMSLMGKEGFKKLALINLERAEYLKSKLSEISGIEIISGATFNEFSVKLKKDAQVFFREMSAKGFIAGLPASVFFPHDKNTIIINATEKKTQNQMDMFITAVKECV